MPRLGKAWAVLAAVALMVLPASQAFAQSSFTFDGEIVFADLEGTVHVFVMDNFVGNGQDVTLPGYRWQGDAVFGGGNTGPDFHLSCSATPLVGTAAIVDVDPGYGDVPSPTDPNFPPFPDGTTVFIVDHDFGRTPGFDSCAGDDFPNLSVTKLINGATSNDPDNPVQLDARTDLEYTIEVRNTGSTTLTSVVVTDELDLFGGELTPQSIPEFCGLVDTLLTCDLGNMAPNDVITFDVILEARSGIGICRGFENFAVAEDLEGSALGISNTVYGNFVACGELEEGGIRIKKETSPAGSSQEFSFTASGPDFGGTDGLPTSFTLTGEGAFADQPANNEIQFPGLTPGVYTFTEDDLPADWSFDRIECEEEEGTTGSVITIDPSLRQATIDLAEGGQVICDFFNEIDRGTIIVEKQTLPEGTTGSFGFEGSWRPDPDNQTFSISAPGQASFSNVPVGSYSVEEISLPTGWRLDSYQCIDDSTEEVLSTGDTGPLGFTLEADQTVRCIFTNELALGQITVVKVADPVESESIFSYSSNFGLTDSDAFTLSGDGTDSSRRTFEGILPTGQSGVFYTASETPLDDWDLTSAVCRDDDPESDANNVNLLAEETIDLQPGQAWTCTFSNSQDLGEIIVRKETVPEGSSETFTFDPSWSNDTFPLRDGQSASSGALIAGTYSVAEIDLPTGWSNDPENTSCDNGDSPGEINLLAGATVTCTFVNRVALGTIIVRKDIVDEDVANTTQEFSFSSDFAGGFILSNEEGLIRETGELLPAAERGVAYRVSENVPAGWTLGDVTCTSSTERTGISPGAIDLLPGETVTCVFPNSIQRGSITIEKVTNPVDEQTDFPFDLTNLPAERITLRHNGRETYTGLLPSVEAGGYSISEVIPEGWDLLEASCTNGDLPESIDLQPGEDVTCTFTNTQELGQIVVIKEVLDEDLPQDYLDSQSFEFDPSWGENFSLGAGDRLGSGPIVAGEYTVGEITPDIWDWELVGVECLITSIDPILPEPQQRTSRQEVVTNPASISLAAGETWECTFTNRIKRGTIVIEKETQPAGSEQLFTFNPRNRNNEFIGNGPFQLADGGSETIANLLPSSIAGNYSVGEVPVDGWRLVSQLCDSPTVNQAGRIPLAAGETVTCTFVNRQTPTVTAAEICIGDAPYVDYEVSFPAPEQTLASSGGGSRNNDVTIRWIPLGTGPDSDVVELTGQPESGRLLWPGAAVDGNNVGVAWPGWTFTAENGWEEVQTALRPQIGFEIEVNGAVSERLTIDYPPAKPTCSTDPRGEIRVVKNTSEPTDEQFTFTLDNDNSEAQVSGSETIGSAEGTFGSFDNLVATSDGGAGVYSVTETPVEGWFLEDAFCDGGNTPSSITLGAGEVVTCTFINNLEPFRVTVTEECRFDVPYVVYDIEPLGQPRLDGPLTIEWLLGGTEPALETLTDQPLSGELLWFGTLLDAQGGLIALPTDQERNNMFLRFTAGDDTAPARRLSYPPLGSSCSLPDPEPVPSLTAVSTWVLALFLLLMGLGTVRYRQLRQ